MSPDVDAQVMQALRDKVGDVDATVRVVKHDLANQRQVQEAIIGRMDKADLRLEKFEERTSAQIEKVTDKIGFQIEALGRQFAAETSSLSAQFQALNVKQEKGTSFYAGMAAVITLVVTIIMGLAKVLFGGHA